MDKHVTINAVGDIWFGDHPVRIGHGVMTKARKKSPEFLFEHTKHLFDDGDYNFCNLESVLSEHGARKWLLSSIEMRGFPDCVNGLLSSHFNIANIANNHILQHGKKAYNETITILKKNDIAIIGADNDGQSEVHFSEKQGIKFAFIGFSLHAEEYYKGDDIAYSYREHGQQILDEVAVLREQFDGFIVCSLHWGQEFIHYPSPEQTVLARALVDKGVNLLLGHHPHVLQGIEEYNNGLICYSLGNYVFDLWPESTKKTILLKVLVAKDHTISYSKIPVYLNNHYQPTVATGHIKATINTELEKYSNAVRSENRGEAFTLEKKRIDKQFRNSQYTYFLKNLYKYPVTMIIQSVMRTLYRRIF